MRSHRVYIVVLSILAAVILLVAATVTLTLPGHPPGVAQPPPALSVGPKVLVASGNSPGRGLLPLPNNTTLTIQVFAPVPAAFETPGTSLPSLGPHLYPIPPGDQTDNGVNDEVLNVTLLPESNVSAFFLSSGFNGIAQAWAGLLTLDSGTNYPSLTVEAVKTVVSNGTLELYTYYNNLPYSPSGLRTVTLNTSALEGGAGAAWFQGTGVDAKAYSSVTLTDLAMNLTLVFPSRPTQVIPLPSGWAGTGLPSTGPAVGRTACAQTGTTCSTSYFYSYPSVTSTELMKTSYVYGILPVMGVHIGRYADGGGSLIDAAASVSVIGDTLELNSAQPYIGSSGQVTTTMSTSPSFTHVANVTAGVSGGAHNAIPTSINRALGANESVALNQTTAFIGIQGTEYEFQNYHEVTNDYTDHWERVCCVHPNGNVYCTLSLLSQKLTGSILDAQYTSGSIVNINSTAGLQVMAEEVSIWAAWTIQHFLGTDSNGSVTLSTSGTDSSYQASTIWAKTTGYLSAANAYGAASNALSTFSTALGVGLALVDATAALNGADFDASEPVVIAETAGIIGTTVGLAATILSQFNSISAWTGTSTVSFGYGFSNQPVTTAGSSYTVQFFESQSPVSFTLPDGASYPFYAPVDFYNATTVG